MAMRNTTIMPAVALSLLGLAALGCAGKQRDSVPWVQGFAPGQGAAGSSVTIAGANFTGVSSVGFGGQPAVVYHVDTSTQITATVPDDAVTGAITVENTKGLGTSYVSFIVRPVISGILTPSGDPVAAGTANDVITLVGSGFYDAGSVAINGETPGQPGASTLTYHDPNHVTVQVGSATPKGAGQVVLTVSGLAATAPFTVN
jgi:hypothetical protein